MLALSSAMLVSFALGVCACASPGATYAARDEARDSIVGRTAPDLEPRPLTGLRQELVSSFAID